MWDHIPNDSSTHIVLPSMRDAEIEIVHHIRCEACFCDDTRGHNIAILPQRLAAHESEKILQAMRSHPGERPMFLCVQHEPDQCECRVQENWLDRIFGERDSNRGL
jgi:hypothetical protein